MLTLAALPASAGGDVVPRGATLPEATELALIRPARASSARDFEFTDADGRPRRLSELRGQIVFINFWATWCAPCREEMPAMERLYRRYRDEGLVMVAVSVDSDTRRVKPFVERHRFTFAVRLDPQMEIAQSYGARALPATFLVDRDGAIAYLALGPRAWDTSTAVALIGRMLSSGAGLRP